MMLRRVHVWVDGRVQGVFFRGATREQARALGISGWVRNLADGQVEIVAEGEHANIEAFLNWCERGPPRAQVDSVQVTEESPRQESIGFEVRRDI